MTRCEHFRVDFLKLQHPKRRPEVSNDPRRLVAAVLRKLQDITSDVAELKIVERAQLSNPPVPNI